MRNALWTMLAAAFLLASCGGGDDEAFKTPENQTPTNPNNPNNPGAVVQTVSVVASTPTLPSSGVTPVEISAFVRDANNNFVPNTNVVFTADSGGLQIVQGTTDDNGLAKAILTTAGDPTNRTITVTATAGNVSGTVSVNVGGSQLSVQGPTALVHGQSATYTINLTDSDGKGIANIPLTVSSARQNGLNPNQLTTNSGGTATFQLAVNNTGDDTLTVTGMGLTATHAVAVNSDAFAFTTPAENAEIPLNTNQTVTIQWTSGGVPQPNQTISFAATRGTLSSTTAQTDANGNATVTISSTNAGGSVITATAAGGATTQRVVEFVAQTAFSIDVQPSVFTMGPGEQSTITAVVRDQQNNLVKNKIVLFSLQDVTGGQLTTAAAITNSQGRAQTVYTAGSTTSARDGVVITASVQDAPTVTDTVALTVAQRQAFLSLGTGNQIEEPNSAQYRLTYVVQVTDASGNGVPGVPLALSILSTHYHKGFRVLDANNRWTTQITATCLDEDTRIPGFERNGVLDPNEDENNNGRIEAGNIATVTPGDATTDANGFALINVLYPQEYAFYLDVDLEVRASVSGTEFVRTSHFTLPGLASDFASASTSPPGMVSPFGVAAVCSDPN